MICSDNYAGVRLPRIRPCSPKPSVTCARRTISSLASLDPARSSPSLLVRDPRRTHHPRSSRSQSPSRHRSAAYQWPGLTLVVVFRPQPVAYQLKRQIPKCHKALPTNRIRALPIIVAQWSLYLLHWLPGPAYHSPAKETVKVALFGPDRPHTT